MRVYNSGVFFFFFFKQKTAYEMLSGDWSSDVCSSDLEDPDEPHTGAEPLPHLFQHLAGPVAGREDFGHPVRRELGVARLRNLSQPLACHEGDVRRAHELRRLSGLAKVKEVF